MAKSMFLSAGQGFAKLFRGLGYVPNPDPGQSANAPANPSVQTGSYQYIIPQMMDRFGVAITNVPTIPGWGVDWGQYPLNDMGLSGQLGGGATGDVPQLGPGGSLYFDPGSNSYLDLSMITGE